MLSQLVGLARQGRQACAFLSRSICIFGTEFDILLLRLDTKPVLHPSEGVRIELRQCVQRGPDPPPRSRPCVRVKLGKAFGGSG